MAVAMQGRMASGSASRIRSLASTSRLSAPARVVRAARRTAVVRASAVVKDDSTGVEFPLAPKFWEGDVFRNLGVGTRAKKILIMNVKVYSVAALVEASKCAKELGLRERGGFFQSDDDYLQAVLDGAFHKILLVRLVRDLEGQQFVDAVDEKLAPRMQLMGETAKLEEFKSVISSKKLPEGSEIAMFWSLAGDLEVLVIPPQSGPRAYDTLKPEARIRSPGLCRALFEIFMGSNSVAPVARAAWVKGVKALLESENVNRQSRKN